MERVSIFLDGANFYHLVLKKMRCAETLFNFDAFAHFLVGTRRSVSKRYYVGTIREREGDERSRTLVAAQVKHLAHLRNCGWETKTSKLRLRTEEIPIDPRVEGYKKILKVGITSIRIERLREKGIDVKLATDLIMGAVDNMYDTAIVISSDSDLVPAIDWVRGRFKKKVEYVGFSIPDSQNPDRSTRPLLSMIAKTDVQRALTIEDLAPFLLPNQASMDLAA